MPVMTTGIVVQTGEAQVGQGAEAGLTQAVHDVVVPGSGDLAGPARPGCGDPD
jgi:hypothetical protein